MWDWTKLFGGTRTPRKPDALEVAFLEQSKVIADAMKRQHELIEQQQQTLDRIVTAKYDRPYVPAPVRVPADQMPSWAMNDQMDVTPDEISAGLSAITADSDAEFLRATGV